MDKWEYLTVELQPKKEQTGKLLNPTSLTWDANYFTEQQDELGRQGWEMVSCFCIEATITNGYSRGTHGVFAAFKRKIQ